jgi:serine/threonine-protein kinase
MAEPILPAAAVGATGVIPATSVQQAVDGTSVMSRAGAVMVEEPPPKKRTGTYFVVLIGALILLAILLFFLARQLGIGSTTKVPVPEVRGKTEQDATAALADVGLKAKSQPVPDEVNPPGRVVDQNPKPPAKISKGSSVTIMVSSGAPPVDVPDVTKRDVTTATDTLEAAGFKVQRTPRSDDSVPADQVLDQDPKGGTKAPKGSTVNLTVSSGPQQIQVPNVAGKDQSSAANILGQAGFNVSTQVTSSDSVPNGTVIRTEPGAGTPLAKGSTVTMIVSNGPPPTTAPPTTQAPSTTRPPATTTSTTL